MTVKTLILIESIRLSSNMECVLTIETAHKRNDSRITKSITKNTAVLCVSLGVYVEVVYYILNEDYILPRKNRKRHA